MHVLCITIHVCVYMFVCIVLFVIIVLSTLLCIYYVQVLILRELAIHTPTLFYQQIQQFFDNIFIAVRDPKVGYYTCNSVHICHC